MRKVLAVLIGLVGFWVLLTQGRKWQGKRAIARLQPKPTLEPKSPVPPRIPLPTKETRPPVG